MQAPNVPNMVYIGSPSTKTTKFNDSLQLTKEGGLTKVNAIKVVYNEKHVVGLTIYYKLADGDTLKARHNTPDKDSKKLQRRVLEIGPDDYLIEVSGHMNEKGITRLTFQTYRGKVGTYGSDEGVPFVHRFNGYTFGAFSGGFKDYIRHLELLVYPVPKQFLEDLKRPVNYNFDQPEALQKRPSADQKGAQIIVVEQVNPFPIAKGPGAPQMPQFAGVYIPQNLINQVKINTPNFPQVGQPQFGYPTNQLQQQQQYAPPMPQQFVQPPPAPFNAPVASPPTNNNPAPLFSSKYPDFK